MNNPFEIIEGRLDNIETLLQRISSQKEIPTPQIRIIPLEKFCSMGFMKLPTAYMRLSKNGEGIPGACKVGKLWFIDLDQFEADIKRNTVTME